MRLSNDVTSYFSLVTVAFICSPNFSLTSSILMSATVVSLPPNILLMVWPKLEATSCILESTTFRASLESGERFSSCEILSISTTPKENNIIAKAKPVEQVAKTILKISCDIIFTFK